MGDGQRCHAEGQESLSHTMLGVDFWSQISGTDGNWHTQRKRLRRSRRPFRALLAVSGKFQPVNVHHPIFRQRLQIRVGMIDDEHLLPIRRPHNGVNGVVPRYGDTDVDERRKDRILLHLGPRAEPHVGDCVANATVRVAGVGQTQRSGGGAQQKGKRSTGALRRSV
jgi:hypothetical protein